MKKLFVLLLIALGLQSHAWAQYKPGDKAIDFKLKNVDGKMVSLKSLNNAKGAIVVFHCNHCPYSQAYEQRILALDKMYAARGYPVVAINPNDPKIQPEDSFDKMKERAKDKGYTFPYLVDATQQIARAYGATRTPHVFVLEKSEDQWVVRYIGAIDDNTENPEKVEKAYVQQAVNALLNGQEPETTLTKAIGCTIKWKKD